MLTLPLPCVPFSVSWDPSSRFLCVNGKDCVVTLDIVQSSAESPEISVIPTPHNTLYPRNGLFFNEWLLLGDDSGCVFSFPLPLDASPTRSTVSAVCRSFLLPLSQHPLQSRLSWPSPPPLSPTPFSSPPTPTCRCSLSWPAATPRSPTTPTTLTTRRSWTWSASSPWRRGCCRECAESTCAAAGRNTASATSKCSSAAPVATSWTVCCSKRIPSGRGVAWRASVWWEVSASSVHIIVIRLVVTTWWSWD